MGTKLVAAAFVASIVPASIGARAADLVPPPSPIGYEEAGPYAVGPYRPRRAFVHRHIVRETVVIERPVVVERPVIVERPVEYRIIERPIVVAPGPAYDEPDDDEYYGVDEPY